MPRRFVRTLWLLGLLLMAATAWGQSAEPPTLPADLASGASAATHPAATPPGLTGLASPTPSHERLLDLHKRVDALKEQIRKTHRRLAGLQHDILEETSSAAHVNLRFDNEFSGYYVITRVLVVLDGVVQYHRQDDKGSLANLETIPLYDGPLNSGPHTVQVLMEARGNGWGPVDYFRSYRFRVRATYSFTALGGRPLSLRLVAYEKGNSTTPFEERPAIRFAQRAGVKRRAVGR